MPTFYPCTIFWVLDFESVLFFVDPPAAGVTAFTQIGLCQFDICQFFPRVENPALWALNCQPLSPRLDITMSPYILFGGRRREMDHICLSSQTEAMLPKGVIEGSVEFEVVDDDGLDDILHEIRRAQGG